MELPGALVAALRQRAGLSQGTLAERAGCTRSTVVRIENGTMDPTVTMLARITSAAGYRLDITTSRTITRHSLAAIAARTNHSEMPFTELRALIDWTRLHPDEVLEAIIDPPTRTGDQHLDNLFAAVAEKLADDLQLQRPAWTGDVAVSSTDWESAGTPRMRGRERAHAPEQFARRRIFLGADSLWRGHRS